MDSCCAGPAPSPDLAALFGYGLLTSAGHCVGMCGPLMAAFSASQTKASWLPSLMAHVGYHTGRLASYFALGAVLGGLTAFASLPFDAEKWQGGLSIGIGTLLSAWALAPLFGRSWTGSLLGSGQAPCSLIGGVFRNARRWGPVGVVLLGGAHGLLPCGPVYAVGLAAASRSEPLGAALAMAAFGLGTVPVLVVLGFGSSSLSVRTRRWLTEIGRVLVIVVGLQLVLRGLRFWSLVPSFEIGGVVLW